MEMVQEFLIPCMEDSDKSNPATLVGSKFLECFRNRSKQDVENELLVVQGKWIEFMRESENRVEV